MNRKHVAGSLLTLAVAGMLTACSNTTESQPKPAAAQPAAPAASQAQPKPDTQPAAPDKQQGAQATPDTAKDKSSCGGANGCGSKKEDDKKEKKDKASCGGANGCGSKK